MTRMPTPHRPRRRRRPPWPSSACRPRGCDRRRRRYRPSRSHCPHGEGGGGGRVAPSAEVPSPATTNATAVAVAIVVAAGSTAAAGGGAWMPPGTEGMVESDATGTLCAARDDDASSAVAARLGVCVIHKKKQWRRWKRCPGQARWQAAAPSPSTAPSPQRCATAQRGRAKSRVPGTASASRRPKTWPGRPGSPPATPTKRGH